MYVPSKFKEADFFKLNKEIREATVAQLKKGKGLLFYGNSGIGKTWNMYAIAMRLEKKIGEMRKTMPSNEHPNGEYIGGFRIRFHNTDRLMFQLKDYHNGGNEMLGNLIDIDRDDRRDILFLDDLGTQKDSPTSIELLTMIFDHRYDTCRSTFISTNYSPEEMAEQLGKRIFSRLQGLCEFIPMVGDDKRIEGNEESKEDKKKEENEKEKEIKEV